MWQRSAFTVSVAMAGIVFALAGNRAAGQGQNVRFVGQIGGGSGAIYVAGNYAYTGEGVRFRILDVSNTSSPVLVGSMALPGVTGDIVVVGGLAYVAGWKAGLEVVDVSDPSRPTLRATCDTPGMAFRLFVAGTLAYVADSASGLQIIDISNPSTPTRRGSYNTPGYAHAVFVSGGLAYVADLQTGLQIIDVSNPVAPTLRGSYDTPGNAQGVFVSGGLAYVGDREAGLQIIDVSNPSAPVFRGSYATPYALGVYVSAGLAYVTNAGAGLQIIDVSNPSAPTLRGSLSVPGSAEGIYVSGSLAYVADNQSGLQIVDVSNPALPTRLGSYGTLGSAWNVHVTSNLAYVTDNARGLHIFDVANPTAPVVLGLCDTPGFANGVFVAGGLAYVGDETAGLQIIDVSNPAAPTRRGSYNTPGNARDVSVSGGLAYVADATAGGLQIIDVSTTLPTLRGSYDTPGDAQGVFVSGGLAYVADGLSGLQIIDVANPAAPTLRSSYDTPGSAWSVHVIGMLAYVADGNSGLQIIDVSNPAAPIRRGSYDTPADARDVFVHGGLAYVADYNARLQIIDVSNPAGPTLRGSYETPGTGWGVFVSFGVAYVTDERGGLWILQYTGEAPRVQGATISDVNNNGLIEAGDQMILTLDRSVVVTTSVLRASHFFLPVAGDSLGGAGFGVGVNRYNSRQIALTLGAGAHLTAASTFSMTNRTPNAPSGIDFATSIPFGAIKSLDGISAIDGGVFGVDDSGIDIELSMVGRTASIAPSGGTIAVVVSPDATYTRHELDIPSGALPATTQFTLRPPEKNLGVINAVQIVSNRPGDTYGVPVTVRVEYREGDIDRERGRLEWEMKVCQLVERPLGVYRYVRVPGQHSVTPAPSLIRTQHPSLIAQHSSLIAQHSSLNTQHSKLESPGGRVSVAITSLNPCGSLGGITVFAGLPIETLDERTINIKPSGGPGPAKSQGGAVLDVGTSGAYTLHKIVFPNFVTTNESDPQRLIVRIRTTDLAERESLCGGCSFPAQSGAVFTVTATNASSQPVAFTSPVDLTVQFKSRSDPTQTDVVHFDGPVADPREMRLVCDRFAGEAVDFSFTTAPLQTVNVSQGTVTVNNFVGLTGSDGRGTFGVVASETALRAARWRLYR